MRLRLRSFIRDDVHDDAVQPGGEQGLALEAIDVPERVEERLLNRVARVLLVRQQTTGDGQQPAAVGPHQPFEGARLAGAKRLEQRRVWGRRLGVWE